MPSETLHNMLNLQPSCPVSGFGRTISVRIFDACTMIEHQEGYATGDRRGHYI